MENQITSLLMACRDRRHIAIFLSQRLNFLEKGVKILTLTISKLDTYSAIFRARDLKFSPKNDKKYIFQFKKHIKMKKINLTQNNLKLKIL